MWTTLSKWLVKAALWCVGHKDVLIPIVEGVIKAKQAKDAKAAAGA
jgi:hypothetical protein